MSTAIQGRLNSRHWSDWAGSAAYVMLAVVIWKSAPRFALLLLPGVVHELFIAAAFLLRGPARSSLRGAGPAVAAYSGTFLMPAFVAVAARWRPQWIGSTAGPDLVAVAFLVWAAGSLLAFWALWHLRNSFSLMPQARQGVYSGPYRLVRHPLYLAYALQYGAIVATHLSAPLLAICTCWVGLMLVRVHYEERVLAAANPEYAHYLHSVGMFGPKKKSVAEVSRAVAKSDR